MSEKNKKIKVLVAMSGGVDSSVAAALLVKDGYDVTGAFMVNYNEDPLCDLPLRKGETADPSLRRRGAGEVSCWRGDYQDALRVAAKLGIQLLRLDFTKEYKRDVLDYMYKEYTVGRTPNPDILCNKFVKFGAWLDWAKKHGFDKLATGHYARLRREFPISNFQFPNKSKYPISNIKLLQSKDVDKDQTYFLHQLSQEQLKYVLFPIGGYTKPEVRALAKKFSLPTAGKEESMGICFVGEVPMKAFLEARISRKKGRITLSDGTVVGEHDGVAFYTIGQRIGLNCHSEGFTRPCPSVAQSGGGGISTGNCSGDLSRGARDDNTKPLYVVAKNIKKNELIVGYDNDPLLYKKEAEVKNINWISGKPPKFPLKCEVRLRHRQPLQKCVVNKTAFRNSPLGRGRGGLVVKFAIPQRAVTPGQFAVFYAPRRSSRGAEAGEKGECLGGGVIL